jgi:hypothetical protein
VISAGLGCTSTKSLNPNSTSYNDKRLVTFYIEPYLHQGLNELNSFENAIAACFEEHKDIYFSQYVYINYDSVLKEFKQSYGNLSYMKKSFASKKYKYKLFAKKASVDHLMLIETETKYDTNTTEGIDYSLFEEIVFNREDIPKKEKLVVREVTYKLKYIDGHSGKKLWQMKLKWSPNSLSKKKRIDPVLLFKEKFELTYPFYRKNPH